VDIVDRNNAQAIIRPSDELERLSTDHNKRRLRAGCCRYCSRQP